MEAIIIICAIVAFLIAFMAIYFKEIKQKLLSKFKKKSKAKPEATEYKPEKAEKTEKPNFTVDDFMPLERSKDDERDPSLEALFGDLEDFDGSENLFDKIPEPNVKVDKSFNDMDFNKKLKELFKEEGKNTKSIADKIRELPPEIKVLLMDNVLKKRDDD